MSIFSQEDCKIKFFDNGFVAYYQGDHETWKVEKTDIKVVSHFSGVNGDNDTDMVVFIDKQGKRYSIDLDLGISNRGEVIKWLIENFNYKKIKDLPNDETPRVIYPPELFGEKPFNNSIRTWLIRHFIHKGDGMVNNKIKEYLNKNGKTS